MTKAAKILRYIYENNAGFEVPFRLVSSLAFLARRHILGRRSLIGLDNGMEIVANIDCHTASMYVYAKVPDPIEIANLRRAIMHEREAGRAVAFLDIGANIGGYSLQLTDLLLEKTLKPTSQSEINGGGGEPLLKLKILDLKASKPLVKIKPFTPLSLTLGQICGLEQIF